MNKSKTNQASSAIQEAASRTGFSVARDDCSDWQYAAAPPQLQIFAANMSKQASTSCDTQCSPKQLTECITTNVNTLRLQILTTFTNQLINKNSN